MKCEGEKNMNTGKLIRDYRRRNNLTCTELANRLEVSAQYLGQVENGRKSASMKLVKGLVEVTNKPYEYWVSDEQYNEMRDVLEKTNDFIDVLISNKLIENEEDILQDAFKKALTAALLADVRHKLDLEESKNKAKKELE